MNSTPPATDAALPARRPPLTLARLARLTLKELRETLRDRRTILTLVLMPVLVYPLLSLAFRQFFLSSTPRESDAHVRIGVATDEEHLLLKELLALGDQRLARPTGPLQPGQALPEQPSEPPLAPPGEMFTASLQYFTARDRSQPIQDLPVDLVVKIESQQAASGPAAEGSPPPLAPPLTCRIWYLPESPVSVQAARHIQQRLRAVNEDYLRRRMRELEPNRSRRTLPVAWEFAQLSGSARRSFWLAALVPLVLITMTITGAVYPAIDLTAGERERGTLESLMAAPVPRLGLLLAKYVAVLTVAMLTAVMNLAAMAITIAASGLAPLLLGEGGLSLAGVLAVFVLLVLFAAFFSAVLLSITSFARSFKEAQAYLIPLMLLSFAPGFLSVMPGLELNGPLAITPLANIVLLARDVLEGDAPPLWAAVAVLSTLLYGALALAVAARIFGSDAILYGSEGSWGDLFRRPAQPRPQATFAGALASLAIVAPLFILLGGAPALFRESSMAAQLFVAAGLTAVIFFAAPWLVARWQGVAIGSGFQLRRASAWSFLAAAILGCSLAPLAYELIIVSRELSLATLSDAQLRQFMERLQAVVGQWRELHPLAILVPLAIVPAICEEWFFRGYLLGALRGRAPAWFAIGATAILFGLFHASLGGVIMVERVLSSTALGVVLGYLCWTSRSVLPGMILHALNNGLMLSLAYWGDGLKSLGLDVQDQQHLPPAWIATAAVATAVGLLFAWLGRRADASLSPAAQPIQPLTAPPEPNAG
jgi:ABC-2 type transport system permease protein/sodium transport system permease protein